MEKHVGVLTYMINVCIYIYIELVSKFVVSHMQFVLSCGGPQVPPCKEPTIPTHQLTTCDY